MRYGKSALMFDPLKVNMSFNYPALRRRVLGVGVRVGRGGDQDDGGKKHRVRSHRDEGPGARGV